MGIIKGIWYNLNSYFWGLGTIQIFPYKLIVLLLRSFVYERYHRNILISDSGRNLELVKLMTIDLMKREGSGKEGK